MATWLSGVKRQSWGRDGGSFTSSPDKILLHSTETGSFPGYGGGASAPHFTIDLENGEVRQHSPMNRAARALRNASGGVQTNRDGVIQIEIIGTCDKNFARKHGYPYLPDMTDEMAGRLKWLLQKICAAIPAIPLKTSVTWKAYPSSYGNSSVRMSNSEWTRYKGILGHQHAPENTHGDPGDLPMKRILGADAVKGGGSSSGGGSTYTSVSGSTPLVKLYHKGEPVERIQKAVGVKVDSYYGPSTAAAVAQFQKAHSLAADKIVGPDTWKAINGSKASRPSAPKAPKFPLPSGHYFGPKSGPDRSHSGYYNHREHLRVWQKQMRKRGWTLKADGLYGNRTKSVALNFQKEKGLKGIDGKIGIETWSAAWEEPVT